MTERASEGLRTKLGVSVSSGRHTAAHFQAVVCTDAVLLVLWYIAEMHVGCVSRTLIFGALRRALQSAFVTLPSFTSPASKFLARCQLVWPSGTSSILEPSTKGGDGPLRSSRSSISRSRSSSLDWSVLCGPRKQPPRNPEPFCLPPKERHRTWSGSTVYAAEAEVEAEPDSAPIWLI